MPQTQQRQAKNRLGISLTDEQVRMLNALCEYETRSQSNMVAVLVEREYRLILDKEWPMDKETPAP